MSEPIIEPTAAELAAELEVLRKTNSELLKKIHDRTTKATELESTVSELQGRLSESADTIKELTIGLPLRQMAESISIAPDLFMEQFSKSYRLEMVKGELTLKDAEGKPLPKAVKFERQALIDLLTTGDDASSKNFKAIVIASRASGAGGVSSTRQGSTSNAPAPKLNFGLR